MHTSTHLHAPLFSPLHLLLCQIIPFQLPNTSTHTHARTLAHPLYGLSPAPALYTSIFVCIISHWLQCKNTDAKQRFKLVINHKAEFLKESFDILGNMLILFFPPKTQFEIAKGNNYNYSNADLSKPPHIPRYA